VVYVPPMSVLKRKLEIVSTKGKLRVNNEYEEFVDILKLLLRAVPVDEAWYLTRYPDVAEAVNTRIFKSAKHHFVEIGYFEGRMPCQFQVDDRWYLEKYADVAEGVRNGDIKSAEEHFLSHGYEEGRLPSEY
jgi:hypothetical protein